MEWTPDGVNVMDNDFTQLTRVAGKELEGKSRDFIDQGPEV